MHNEIWGNCNNISGHNALFCFVHFTRHQAGVMTMYEKSPRSTIIVRIGDREMFTRTRAGISTGF